MEEPNENARLQPAKIFSEMTIVHAKGNVQPIEIARIFGLFMGPNAIKIEISNDVYTSRLDERAAGILMAGLQKLSDALGISSAVTQSFDTIIADLDTEIAELNGELGLSVPKRDTEIN